MQIVARHFRTLRPVRITIERTRIVALDDVDTVPDELPTLPLVAPGLLDIQVNGYGGQWFSSEQLTIDSVRDIVARLSACGVARCLPTLITNSREALRHGLATIRAACHADAMLAAQLPGIHLEGPWISGEDGPRGAHPQQHVRPADVDELQSLVKVSGGLLKLLTVAPEVLGCETLIRAAVAMGLAVSIGHTAATREQIARAVACGARLSTHLGNGIAGTLPRHDNPLWPQLADDRLTAGIITDGFHLPDDVVRCVLRCKSPARLIVTCDVSGFGGCDAGRHRHGGLEVEVLPEGRVVVAGQRQYLAGSAATTLDCLTQLTRVSKGTLSEAWPLICDNPLRAAGQEVSGLEAGAPATLNLVRSESLEDGGLRVTPVRTFVNGTEIGR